MPHSIAVMVILETDNPVLDPETIDVSTIAGTVAVRRAVIDALPNLSRVVMVMPEEHARLMAAAHHIAATESGLADNIRQPPPDYRAPHDSKRRRF